MNSVVPFARYVLASLAVQLCGVSVVLAAEGDANERAIENLAQFAKLYGYVRFFHPSDESASIDWDKFAMLGAQTVRDVGDDEALRQSLRELFEPIAFGLRVTPAADRTNSPSESQHVASERHTFWQHSGIRLSPQSNIYQSRRVIDDGVKGDRAPLFQPIEPPPRTLEKLLGPDIAIELPLALSISADSKASIGKSAELAALRERLAAPNLTSVNWRNWRCRVAGVIIAWNVFQHFHPYIDSIGLKWEEVLRPTLRRALADRTFEDYHATLSELVARLQDGHGFVHGRMLQARLPIRVELIEDQMMITAVASGASFQKGDIITRIDDIEALQALRQLERYVSGSPQVRRFRALELFGQGPEDSVVRLEILRDGARLQVEVKRIIERFGFYLDPIVEFQFPPFSKIRPGIFYVNMPSIQPSVLEQRLPELATAQGVIFDQRWDGRMGINVAFRNSRIRPAEHVIPHLIDKTVHASPMRIPHVTQPDRAGWAWSEGTWPVEPKEPRLKGRIVFINDPSVVSHGETCMAMIAHFGLAKLVGAPTAGCNGNINVIPLPGGFRMHWTGMEVLKHDRSPLYLTGFVPDHPVARTKKAVKEGRDEYLEKAIAVIEQSADSTKP